MDILISVHLHDEVNGDVEHHEEQQRVNRHDLKVREPLMKRNEM